MTPLLLVITGPTAVGKTDVALHIAHAIPSEIINADVGQLYTPLTIGTAKPDWKNDPVAHHLFDSISTPANFSVAEFRKRVLELSTQILARGRLPIIVGGSAFYIQSLFFPLKVHDQQGISEKNFSWDDLYAIDPERAKKIHKNDTYRINRAMNLWLQTGMAPSSLSPDFQPPMPFYYVMLAREKDDLYCRIDQRVVQMIDQGWVAEVESLRSTPWESFLKTKKIIGYDIILDYLNHGTAESKRSEMIALIQKKTRHYAKKQITFFKMLEKKIEEGIAQKRDSSASLKVGMDIANLTLVNVDLYIKQLLKMLSFHVGILR